MNSNKKITIGIGTAVAAAGLIYALWPTSGRVTKSIPREKIKEREDKPATTNSPAPRQISVTPVTNSVPNSLLAPKWKERPATEWQGMQVDLNATPYCEESSLCGLARACKNKVCTACEQDSECAPKESCVMDHCLLSDLVECHAKSDCGDKGACILSGYSSGPRGNKDLKAYCVDLASGASSKPPVELEPAKDPRTSLPDDGLIEKAKQAAAK